jgi:acyl-CoA thioesterase
MSRRWRPQFSPNAGHHGRISLHNFPKSNRSTSSSAFAQAPATWVKQYDFRFVEGFPALRTDSAAQPASALSKLWIGDRIPRKIDFLSLMAMSDAFFARIYHARGEMLPFGTVTITTYFHADADDLAKDDITRVLAVADASTFHKSYGDQAGALWSPSGRLLATTTQMMYFKA